MYRLRIHTSSARGAALSDNYSAVNILLVGTSGQFGLLQRISSLEDNPQVSVQAALTQNYLDASILGNMGSECC
jgi:hypothetical protein